MSNVSNPNITTNPPSKGPQVALQPGSNTFSPIPPGFEAVTVNAIPVIPLGQQVLVNEPSVVQGNAGGAKA